MTTLFELSVRLKEASELLKKDTLASYYAAEYQFTIGKIIPKDKLSNDSSEITLDDLNEEGIKIYNTIQEKMQKGEWEKQVFKDASMEMTRSGEWKRDNGESAAR